MAGSTLAVTTIEEFTVTVTVAEPVHPLAEPVTVYVVVVAGVTESVDPLRLPGIQLKLVPVTLLLAVSVDDWLEQMVVGSAVAVTVGFGFTVMVYVAVAPVQPLAAGVIVMTPLIGPLVEFVAVKEGILPVPLAPNPIAVLLLFHEKLTPAGVPVGVPTGTVSPLQ